jgi:hypothetical protein
MGLLPLRFALCPSVLVKSKYYKNLSLILNFYWIIYWHDTLGQFNNKTSRMAYRKPWMGKTWTSKILLKYFDIKSHALPSYVFVLTRNTLPIVLTIPCRHWKTWGLLWRELRIEPLGCWKCIVPIIITTRNWENLKNLPPLLLLPNLKALIVTLLAIVYIFFFIRVVQTGSL